MLILIEKAQHLLCIKGTAFSFNWFPDPFLVHLRPNSGLALRG
uniref:Uncharacterized protein n=1 Tax=Tetranychus urticae TaxID=32264 RepID=T1KGD2_TETUR